MTGYVDDSKNLMATQGQDYAFQVWTTDHRGEAVPYTIPAKMTVKDKVGQIAFETTDDSSAASTDAVILTSPVNGLVQVTVPKAILQELSPGTYVYDIWATVIDTDTASVFPEGQTVPVQSGRFTVRSRTTVMEGVTP